MIYFFLFSILPQIVVGFFPGSIQQQQQHNRMIKESSFLLLKARATGSYGPPVNEDDILNAAAVISEQEQAVIPEAHINKLRGLITKILVGEIHEVNSLLASNVDFFLTNKPSIFSQSDVLQSIVDENPPQEQEKVMAIIEYIASFVKDLVEEAVTMDKENKELLGKVLKIMCGENKKDDDVFYINVKKSASQREDELDDFMEAHAFSPGFLRHLEGECERIENAPKTTKESLRLAEVLRTIRIRVIEELGVPLGEGASVLGQLLAYDDPKEQLAVLQTGLELRGIEFANEMLKMTEEALGQMKTLDPAIVDPELITKLEAIRKGIKSYVSTSWMP